MPTRTTALTIGQDPADPALAPRLTFVRHGATPPNLAGLRCGGDLDVALTDLGRQQARAAAQQIAALDQRIGLVVTSGLQRADETAHIIAQALGGVVVTTLPALAERRLGEWNLRSIAATEALIAAGATPPGGESNAAFTERIAAAVVALLPRLQQRVLLVGSKGVARVLGELAEHAGSARLANGQVVQFDLSRLGRLEIVGSNA